ncbi:MAG: hypothetical protein IJ099_07060 [Alphaproteobacteria bacterium]|nr:hypothetical protein [Alphaproteobacteria bacterium]
MAKIRAIITLVVGKGKQITPNGVCDVSDAEAKRLIALGYAESLKKNTPPTNTETEEDDDKSDENGDRQPVQPDGKTGDVQK